MTETPPVLDSTQQIAVPVSNLTNVTATLFAQNAVRSLTELDFELNTDHPVTLINKEMCGLILFYTENTESKDLAQIWTQVAQVAPGPLYGAVNMMIYPRVAQAFMSIGTKNTSLRPFELKGYPFILSYQNGWPVAFYNGERSVGTIAEWALTLACRPQYYEPMQLAGGIQVDQDFEMGGWKEYTPPRVDSLEYTIASPIRKYTTESGVNQIKSGERTTEVPTVGSGVTPAGTISNGSPGVVSPGAGATT